MSLDVKEGHCYIDRHCYANGEAAPYPGHHCQKCDRYSPLVVAVVVVVVAAVVAVPWPPLPKVR